MSKNKYAYVGKVKVGDILCFIPNLESYKVTGVKTQYFDPTDIEEYVVECQTTGIKRIFNRAAIRECTVNVSELVNSYDYSLFNDLSGISDDELKSKLTANRIGNVSYSNKDFELLNIVRKFWVKHAQDMKFKNMIDYLFLESRQSRHWRTNR